MNVLVDQRIHAFTLILRTVAQSQQAADFLERHVEGAAVADEGQALGVSLASSPIFMTAISKRVLDPIVATGSLLGNRHLMDAT